MVTFSSPLFLLILTMMFCFGTVLAADRIIHDAEYYVLEAQNAGPWAAEDRELDAKIRAARRAAKVTEDYLYPFELYWEIEDPAARAAFTAGHEASRPSVHYPPPSVPLSWIPTDRMGYPCRMVWLSPMPSMVGHTAPVMVSWWSPQHWMHPFPVRGWSFVGRILRISPP